MSSHRIEITFVGDAPDSELERAKILGSDKVSEAIDNLGAILTDLGLPTKVTATTIRAMPAKKRKSPAPALTSFVAEPARDAAE